MQIVVIAGGLIQNEFNDKGIAEGVQLKFVTAIEDAGERSDVYFYLLDETTIPDNYEAIKRLSQLVFVNAITTTLSDLPTNTVRINGWPGFIHSKSSEISTSETNKEAAARVLDAMGWDYIFVPDLPGMITPRTISMIINEAYFAFEEEVSTKEEIDIAMKLGTGYPFGPFEWSQQIGLNKILHLLQTLALTDPRYQPAPLLISETNLNWHSY